MSLDDLATITELAVVTLSYCEVSDLYSVMQLSKTWFFITNDSHLWRTFFYRDFVLNAPSSQKVGHVANFKDEYKKTVFANAQFFKTHYDLSSKNRNQQNGVNKGKSLIASCYRGKVQRVTTQFIKGKPMHVIVPSLNTKDYYRQWVFNGITSSDFGGWIKFGAPSDGVIINSQSKTTRNIYFPSTEDGKLDQLKPYTGTALHWAAMSGQLEIVKMLCEAGCGLGFEVDAYNATAEDIAKANGHLLWVHLNS